VNYVLRRIFIWLFALAGVVQSASASAHPATITRKTPGGLVFRYAQLPEQTHQVVSFAWRDGTAIARPEWAVVSVLATDLLLEGPRGVSRSEYAEELEDLLATASFTGNAAHIRGRLSAPAEHFREAAKLLSRTIVDPALPEEKLADIRKRGVANNREASENPQTLANRLLMRVILGNSPHANFHTAEVSDYEKVTIKEIHAWRRDVLARDNLLVATAGPMDVDEVARAIDTMFSGLPESANLPVVTKPAVHSVGKFIVLEQPVVQTAIAAGGLTTLSVTPDFDRADLAKMMLVGELDSSTGLTAVVRQRLGASYGVSVSLGDIDASTISLVINALVSNGRAVEAIAAIRTEYSRFLTDGIPANDLEPLKTSFVSAVPEVFQSAQGLADTLLNHARDGFPDDFLHTYEQRVRSYSAEEISAEMVRHFPSAPTLVVIAPSAAGMKADCIIKTPAEITACK
jgi:zinc protease